MAIKTDIADGVARIEIARPQKKNAITGAMYLALAEALDAAGRERSVRAILLHGQDDIFTAGNDLDDFRNAAQVFAERPSLRFMQALIATEKPVVAAVNGAAVGIGTTLLLHCDLVYCADNAMFAMPFVSLGLCPEFASSLLVPLNGGFRRASEKLLLGEPISPEEAVEMNIVNRILPPAEVFDYALRQARRFVGLPPDAVRTTKRLLRRAWRPIVEQAIADESRAFGDLLQGPAAKEAFSAFFERRKPDFSRFD